MARKCVRISSAHEVVRDDGCPTSLQASNRWNRPGITHVVGARLERETEGREKAERLLGGEEGVEAGDSESGDVTAGSG
jgi:hypothetical protein